MVRYLLYFVIEKYPETIENLPPSSNIANIPLFDSTIMKVKMEIVALFTSLENSGLYVFPNEPGVEEIFIDEGISYMKSGLKIPRRSLGASFTMSSYFTFLLTKSDIFERLFSNAGYEFKSRPRCLNQINLESQIFLNFNNFPEKKKL